VDARLVTEGNGGVLAKGVHAERSRRIEAARPSVTQQPSSCPPTQQMVGERH
jgi:hypothetical protein